MVRCLICLVCCVGACCWLYVVYCLLRVVCGCVVSVVHWLLFLVRCVLFVVWYVLIFVARCCLQFLGVCFLLDMCGSWCVVRCLLFVVCYRLFVVCYLLFVVCFACCSLFVLWCCLLIITDRCYRLLFTGNYLRCVVNCSVLVGLLFAVCRSLYVVRLLLSVDAVRCVLLVTCGFLLGACWLVLHVVCCL